LPRGYHLQSGSDREDEQALTHLGRDLVHRHTRLLGQGERSHAPHEAWSSLRTRVALVRKPRSAERLRKHSVPGLPEFLAVDREIRFRLIGTIGITGCTEGEMNDRSAQRVNRVTQEFPPGTLGTDDDEKVSASEQLLIMKKELDLLQIELAAPKVPWY
jgi:hypothetical protein